MKHFLSLLLLTIAGTLGAQTAAPDRPATGITFVKKPFAELLAQAKAEDKILFIDAYTTWCGPCKMMTAKVFPQADVGEVYNERFVNTKIDMEKGEGPGLARRYGVMAYPTYLFVDGNGKLVHRGVGYIPGEAFIELGLAASGPGSYGAMTKRYEAGERGGAFLSEYVTLLAGGYDRAKAEEVTAVYLATQADWNTPATLKVIVANPGPLSGKRLRYLIDHSEAAIRATSANQVMMALQERLVSDKMNRLGQRKLPTEEEMAQVYDAHGGPLAPRLKAHYAMFFAQRTGDDEAYLPAALHYLDTYGSDDAAELNSVAWTIFEQSDDQTQLKKALAMAKRSVALAPAYPNTDTLAWLYFKTGDKKMARKTAREAIILAKKTDQDYSDTARILEQ